VRAARVAYYGEVTHIDHAIGRVLAGLGQAGILDDTLILFASDHGEYLGDHCAGGKRFFHDVSARVPMILRLPQSVADRPRGAVCDELVTLADILPTLVPDADVEGVSLIETARGIRPRDHVTFTAGHSMGLGVTDGRWKYLYYPQGACEQLFDLQEDPGEQHDRAETERETVATLRQLLVADVGELPGEPVAELTPDYLRVLGIFNDEAPIDVRH
jgi:arylsulfatase A-like enzyme